MEPRTGIRAGQRPPCTSMPHTPRPQLTNALRRLTPRELPPPLPPYFRGAASPPCTRPPGPRPSHPPDHPPRRSVSFNFGRGQRSEPFRERRQKGCYRKSKFVAPLPPNPHLPSPTLRTPSSAITTTPRRDFLTSHTVYSRFTRNPPTLRTPSGATSNTFSCASSAKPACSGSSTHLTRKGG